MDFFEIYVPQDEPPSTEKEKLFVKIGYLKSDQRTSSIVTGAVFTTIFSVIVLSIIAIDAPIILMHVKTMMFDNIKYLFIK